VQGPQTAKVVGKNADQNTAMDQQAGGDGEEIWVDKWGRVLVLFPWDRKAASSCWMRVSQDWAGAGWGMVNIPRVGQEVVVSFLEGDPDRPLITGRVYNDQQTLPYALPDNGTRTTFRTSSSTGGGTTHYNELRFEDKTGKEQIFLRGEKDYDTRILNDSREWIGGKQSIMVKKDRMEKVEGDESIQITGNRMEKVGGDDSLDITGKLNVKSGSDISLNAAMDLYTKSGTNYAHQAGTAIHLKAGTTMVLEAGVQLSLKAGGSFIDIGPAGIAISGAPLVMINSGGSAGSGSGSSPNSPDAPKDPDEADDGSKGTKM
jgi:type VI secretion system secreted protein VgrG